MHFVLHKFVTYEIEKITGNFLCYGPKLEPNKSRVTWDLVSRPLDEGGLGIMKLKEVNIAFLAKLF